MVKGSFEYLLAEKAEFEAAMRRDAATRERRRLDDENLEARRLEEAAAMKREAEAEDGGGVEGVGWSRGVLGRARGGVRVEV